MRLSSSRRQGSVSMALASNFHTEVISTIPLCLYFLRTSYYFSKRQVLSIIVMSPFWPLFYREAEQAFPPVPETLGVGVLLQQRLGFRPQHLTLQGLALVVVRRPPVLLVPGAGPPVHQLLMVTRPRPRLHRREQPPIEVERPDVGLHVAQLLLARAPHLLEVLERLLQRPAVRHQLQYLPRRHARVGAEVGPPAVWLVHQHHPDHATGRPPRRRKRLDALALGRAVLDALDRLPAPLLPGTLGQFDARLAVGGQGAPLSRPAPGERQAPQRGVLGQPADHRHAQLSHPP